MTATAIATFAGAETLRWTNPAGGLWTDPANWSPMQAPTLSDSAVLDLDAAYRIFGNGGANGLLARRGDVTLEGLHLLTHSLDIAPLDVDDATLAINGTLLAADVRIGLGGFGALTLAPGDALPTARPLLSIEDDIRLSAGDGRSELLLDRADIVAGSVRLTPENGSAHIGLSGQSTIYVDSILSESAGPMSLDLRDGSTIDALLRIRLDSADGTLNLQDPGTSLEVLTLPLALNEPALLINMAQATISNEAQILLSKQGVAAIAADDLQFTTGAFLGVGCGAPCNGSSNRYAEAHLTGADFSVTSGAQLRAAPVLQLSAEVGVITGAQTRVRAATAFPSNSIGIPGQIVFTGDWLVTDEATVDAFYLIIDGAGSHVRFERGARPTPTSTINVIGDATCELADGVSVGGVGIVLFDAESRLKGFGVIEGGLLNGGIVEPGEGIGRLIVRRNYIQQRYLWTERYDKSTPVTRYVEPGTLRIEMTGRGRENSDILEINGDASLGGAVEFVLTQHPVRPGDYTFLRAKRIFGSFQEVVFPPMQPGFRAKLYYFPDRIVLRVRGRGDIDRSGGVDGRDLAALLARWNTDDPDADLNADGVVSGEDLAALLAEWTGEMQ